MIRPFTRAALVFALCTVAAFADAEPKPTASAATRSGVRRAVVALRQSAEGVMGPQIAPHDRAAIATQRLTDVVAALSELPSAQQSSVLGKLRGGSTLSKGIAQGLNAYRAARQHAGGDPGKLSRSQSALQIGVAKLVVEGNAQFSELSDKAGTKPLEGTEPVLKRAEGLKAERWNTLKKDLVALAGKLDDV